MTHPKSQGWVRPRTNAPGASPLSATQQPSIASLNRGGSKTQGPRKEANFPSPYSHVRNQLRFSKEEQRNSAAPSRDATTSCATYAVGIPVHSTQPWRSRGEKVICRRDKKCGQGTVKGISDIRARGWGRCGHLRGPGPPRVHSGGLPAPGPQTRQEAGAIVPAGVLRGAAATARLAAEATPLSGSSAAATAAGGRSEGDTVAPRRKPGLPQPGPRRGRPGWLPRLSLPRRPLPTPTCSGVTTWVESTAVSLGELSRTVRQRRGEQELPGLGSGNVQGSPGGEDRGTAEAAQRHPRGQDGSGHASRDGAGRCAPQGHVHPLCLL